MARIIFVNLPVADVDRSTAFYEAVGAAADPHFRQSGTAAMLRFSDTINVMLLNHARFADFTPKRIVDARTDAQVLLCLSCESRAEVDDMMARAVSAGAGADPCPPQDVAGIMYGRSFEDPDGHIVELMWMDVDAMMAAMPAAGAEG